MKVKDKQLRETIKLGIKTLIIQEVRVLGLERTLTPRIILDEMLHSIQDTKKKIVKLTERIAEKERAVFLKKMIQQAVDEEIDRAIQFRKNRCLRCIHGRFYDRSERAYSNLPIDKKLAKSFGCDRLRPALRKTCKRFVETTTALSLENYLEEVNFLYEFREGFDQIEELWQEYFNK